MLLSEVTHTFTHMHLGFNVCKDALTGRQDEFGFGQTTCSSLPLTPGTHILRLHCICVVSTSANIFWRPLKQIRAATKHV